MRRRCYYVYCPGVAFRAVATKRWYGWRVVFRAFDKCFCLRFLWWEREVLWDRVGDLMLA